MTELEYWQDKFSNALQSDLENGVKWVNEMASLKFTNDYPELSGVLSEFMLAGEDGSND